MSFIDLIEICETDDYDEFIKNIQSVEKLSLDRLNILVNGTNHTMIIDRLVGLGAIPPATPPVAPFGSFAPVVASVKSLYYEFVGGDLPYVVHIPTGNEYCFEEPCDGIPHPRTQSGKLSTSQTRIAEWNRLKREYRNQERFRFYNVNEEFIHTHLIPEGSYVTDPTITNVSFTDVADEPDGTTIPDIYMIGTFRYPNTCYVFAETESKLTISMKTWKIVDWDFIIPKWPTEH